MNTQLDDMYRDVILDHYRFPRGKKALNHFDIQAEGMNPACGDEIAMELELENNKVKDLHVDCRGCAISVASGSMLAEISKGKTIEELKELSAIVKKMLKGEPVTLPKQFGDLDALQGVKQFPVRIKCALLAWVTLISGISNYEQGIKTAASASTENMD